MTKYIDRQKTIQRFIKEHEELRNIVLSLTEEQVLHKKILGGWTIKDVVAHLAAWNWEAIDEVGRVLKNQATWPARYENRADEDEFNKKAVEKRKGLSWKEVLKDWEDSFSAQIKLMEKLSQGQWRHQSGNEYWSDGTPVTVWSLFAYDYEGVDHEGGHAKQIKQHLMS